jgi:hypothetical protein
MAGFRARSTIATVMPEISRFFGIVIRMYFFDHEPPHFHAYYGGAEAQLRSSRSACLAVIFRLVPWRSSSSGLEFMRRSW